jgi:hypothetical protein
MLVAIVFATVTSHVNVVPVHLISCRVSAPTLVLADGTRIAASTGR